MSDRLPPAGAADFGIAGPNGAAASAAVLPVAPPLPGAPADGGLTAAAVQPVLPRGRAWARFRRNRLGTVSLWIMAGLLVLSVFAEFISNDRPLAARYQGHWSFPVFHNPPETFYGGDFETETDWKDPFIVERFAPGSGNYALLALNPHSANSTDYFQKDANPAPPSAKNWLGTDSEGRDMVARLLYGFRISIFFALALTAVGTVIGVFFGAIQGYFGGRIDLATQRLLEIWNSIPELYLLIIFASIFEPSLGLLLVLLSLFGWIGLSDYVRAEFFRNRSLEYVKAARALGLSSGQIIWRHVLPNSLTPVITFLPFRMSAAILALVSLDFLGLGVPASVPSLGELVKQGKENLDAWWIIFPTFVVLVVTLLLLTFIGDALRDAFDTRKS